MSSAEFETLTDVEPSDVEGDFDCGIERRHPVQSPRIVLPLKRKKWCAIFLVILVILVTAIIVLYNGGDGSGYTHTNLEARVGGAWPRSHNNHLHFISCEDDGIDCCHIYDYNLDYTISPRRIVKRDKLGSNCPSLSTLVANYNDYHIRDFGRVNCSTINCCTIDIFRDELLRHNITVEDYLIPIEVSKDNLDMCPSIETLITKYENYYVETDTTFLILFIAVVICCWLCSTSVKV